MAGVAQPYIHLRFTWQAWHNLTSTFVSRGGRGTPGTPWRAWVWFGGALVARDAVAFCVAGVAQPYIHLRFTWQAWHNLTSTFVSRGRRGTHGTPRHFAWQVWHNVTSNFVTYHLSHTITSHTQSHPPSFRVAGVALMALRGTRGSGLGAPWSRVTPRHFAWQAWHNLTSTFVSRGRRGTISHPPSFRVAGVALMALRGALGSRGRRGTILHPPSFRVAGVALMALRGALGSGLGVPWSCVTPRHFAWQAWHNLTSTFVSRGRRGTISHPPSFRVAGTCDSLGRNM